MDLWKEAEIKIRRDDALENARNGRLARRAARRGTRARDNIAYAAEALSDALAALARSLRNGEAA